MTALFKKGEGTRANYAPRGAQGRCKERCALILALGISCLQLESNSFSQVYGAGGPSQLFWLSRITAGLGSRSSPTLEGIARYKVAPTFVPNTPSPPLIRAAVRSPTVSQQHWHWPAAKAGKLLCFLRCNLIPNMQHRSQFCTLVRLEIFKKYGCKMKRGPI